MTYSSALKNEAYVLQPLVQVLMHSIYKDLDNYQPSCLGMSNVKNLLKRPTYLGGYEQVVKKIQESRRRIDETKLRTSRLKRSRIHRQNVLRSAVREWQLNVLCFAMRIWRKNVANVRRQRATLVLKMEGWNHVNSDKSHTRKQWVIDWLRYMAAYRRLLNAQKELAKREAMKESLNKDRYSKTEHLKEMRFELREMEQEFEHSRTEHHKLDDKLTNHERKRKALLHKRYHFMTDSLVGVIQTFLEHVLSELEDVSESNVPDFRRLWYDDPCKIFSFSKPGAMTELMHTNEQNLLLMWLNFQIRTFRIKRTTSMESKQSKSTNLGNFTSDFRGGFQLLQILIQTLPQEVSKKLEKLLDIHEPNERVEMILKTIRDWNKDLGSLLDSDHLLQSKDPVVLVSFLSRILCSYPSVPMRLAPKPIMREIKEILRDLDAAGTIAGMQKDNSAFYDPKFYVKLEEKQEQDPRVRMRLKPSKILIMKSSRQMQMDARSPRAHKKYDKKHVKIEDDYNTLIESKSTLSDAEIESTTKTWQEHVRFCFSKDEAQVTDVWDLETKNFFQQMPEVLEHAKRVEIDQCVRRNSLATSMRMVRRSPGLKLLVTELKKREKSKGKKDRKSKHARKGGGKSSLLRSPRRRSLATQRSSRAKLKAPARRKRSSSTKTQLKPKLGVSPSPSPAPSPSPSPRSASVSVRLKLDTSFEVSPLLSRSPSMGLSPNNADDDGSKAESLMKTHAERLLRVAKSAEETLVESASCTSARTTDSVMNSARSDAEDEKDEAALEALASSRGGDASSFDTCESMHGDAQEPVQYESKENQAYYANLRPVEALAQGIIAEYDIHLWFRDRLSPRVDRIFRVAGKLLEEFSIIERAWRVVSARMECFNMRVLMNQLRGAPEELVDHHKEYDSQTLGFSEFDFPDIWLEMKKWDRKKEMAKLLAMLRKYSEDLRKIFLNYAQADNEDVATSMLNEIEYWQFVKDAKILTKTFTKKIAFNVFDVLCDRIVAATYIQRWFRYNVLSFKERSITPAIPLNGNKISLKVPRKVGRRNFIACVVRLAHLRETGSLAQRFESMMKLLIINTCQLQSSGFRAQIRSERFFNIFKSYRWHLRHIFVYFAGQIANPAAVDTTDETMNLQEWANLLRCCRLLEPDGPITHENVITIFNNTRTQEFEMNDASNSVLEHECLSHLTYPEFLEALVILACFKHPDPYVSLKDKFLKFLKEGFLPNCFRWINSAAGRKMASAAESKQVHKELTRTKNRYKAAEEGKEGERLNAAAGKKGRRGRGRNVKAGR
eukprot:CAMPEP_0197530338 /NCGR_PEP_ID=MMETSP1318-20131121/31463_1 /TAXON_ID=552666 /ORGANISM="Partenskyella glossopodia, Strain RCC365" /LENGTH=1287 /DNA_ID=CAMNT_0043086117 /DNA_START=73 /DNA_END=3936 /DNA_ORIENTATION=-